MKKQETLDDSKYKKYAQYIRTNRKNVCLGCKGALPNNHWSFCSYTCKDAFVKSKIKYLSK